MKIRMFSTLIGFALLFLNCNLNSNKSENRNIPPKYKIIKIQCILETPPLTTDIYTIQNDTLYSDLKKIKMEDVDMQILLENVELINATPKLRTGGCIENDAPGIKYRFFIDGNISEWIICFSNLAENGQSPNINTITEILNKYFYLVQDDASHGVIK